MNIVISIKWLTLSLLRTTDRNNHNTKYIMHYVARGLSAGIYAEVQGFFDTTLVENEVLPVFVTFT